MKYLFDVNLSKTLKDLEKNPDYQNVKNLYGEQITDDEILKLADKNVQIIVTQDIKLALYALIEGFKVWYKDQKKSDNYYLTAQSFSNLHFD